MSRLEDRINDWIGVALGWDVQAQPIFFDEQIERETQTTHVYGYFSPSRPLDFVFITNVILLHSSEPYKDFMFVSDPLSNEQIYKWDLVPYTQQAKEACDL